MWWGGGCRVTAKGQGVGEEGDHEEEAGELTVIFMSTLTIFCLEDGRTANSIAHLRPQLGLLELIRYSPIHVPPFKLCLSEMEFTVKLTLMVNWLCKILQVKKSELKETWENSPDRYLLELGGIRTKRPTEQQQQ